MIDYDEKTALVVVDVQNDFADPQGNLYVSGGEDVVDAANSEVAKALDAGAFLVYTQDWHPESTPHFQKDGGIWPVHCVMGTWGAEFHPGLRVEGPVVRKGSNGEDGYSGFTMRDPVSGKQTATELRRLLDDQGIEKLVVVGLALDYCVKATALDGAEDFDVTVLSNATAAVNLDPNDGAKSINDLEATGVTVA